MNCYCDYEPSDVWNQRRVKARKAWKCGECCGTISIGETYHRAKSLYDGRWDTFRRCEDCMVIACDLKKLERLKDFCFCDLWGGMTHAMGEAWDYSFEHHELLRPIFGAFNAASKARGGYQIHFEEDEE